MNTPALAIGWSLWARHRAGHVAVLAALPLCAALYRFLFTLIPERLADSPDFLAELPLTILPMVLSLVWALYVFAQTENDVRKGFTGFPLRMFVLPVRTRFLVTCHMAYGIAGIFLLYLGWAWLVFAPVGVHLELRWPLLLLAFSMLCFQAAVWGLASFPWIRAAVIGAGGLFFGPLIAIASVPELGWQGRGSTHALWTLAALPIAYAAAFAMVQAERRGGWQPWDPAWRFVLRRVDSLRGRPDPFASPSEAIAWLEWRRKGRLSSLWLAFSIAGAVCLLPVVAMGTMGLPPWYSLLIVFPWPLLMGGLLGNFLARPDLTGEVALPPFHAIKPVTNSQWVLIKLKVAAGVTLAGWLFALPLAWAVFHWPQWQEMSLTTDLVALARWIRADPAWMAGLVLFGAVLTWKSMVDALSLGLVGNPRQITTRTFFAILFFVGGLSAALWCFRRPALLTQVEPYLYGGIGLLMAAKLRGFHRAFAALRRNHLATPVQWWLLLALWFFLALSVLAGTALLWLKIPLPGSLLIGAAAWSWPAGELAQAVLHLSANRHR